MVELLAVFIAKLLSPLAIVAIACGWLSKSWVHVLIAAIVLAVAQEALLHFMQHSRTLSITPIAIGAIAMFVWSSVSFLFARRRRNNST